MTENERELYDALRTAREALCGAMRVIADCDAMKLLGAEDDTREERFVAELKTLGITNGFGKRIDDVLRKYGQSRT